MLLKKFIRNYGIENKITNLNDNIGLFESFGISYIVTHSQSQV